MPVPAMNVTNVNALDSFKARQNSFLASPKEAPKQEPTQTEEPVKPVSAPEGIAEEETTQQENNQPSQDAGNPPEQESEKPESTEAKRLHDAQRKITEMGEAKRAYEKLLEPFKDTLVYDEFGRPVKFDFSKIKQPQTQPDTEPKEPTEAEWEEAQFDAKKMRELTKRQNAFDLFQDRKTSKAEREKEANEARQNKIAEAFNSSQEKAHKAACESYTDYGKEGTPFRIAAENLVKENPALVYLPNADWVIANMVAVELKVSRKEPASAKPLPQKSSMMGLGKTGSSNTTIITNPHLQKFKESQKRFLKTA